jgi:hypothetical protein
VSRVDELKEQVRALSEDELAELRDWLLDEDWKAWDAQLERDDQAGRLDALAEAALRAHADGKTTPL